MRLLLRAVALVGVVLLLLDPALPGEDPARSGGAVPLHWVVLELHPALQALGASSAEAGPGEGHALLLDEAVAAARRALGPGAGLLLVGPDETLVRAGADTLATLGPEVLGAPPGALARSLQALALAGARSATVVSPFREGGGVAEEGLLSSGLAVERVPVGAAIRNAGIAEVEFPARGTSEGVRRGSVVVVGEGGTESDSLELRVRIGEGGAERVVARAPLPQPGERRRIPVELAPGEEGVLAFRVGLPGDRYPADDTLRVELAHGEQGGILLVSTAPDGEPRQLLPLLEAATGLSGEGWIQVGPDRFLALDPGGGPTRFTSLEALRERADQARLLVLQGDGLEVPHPALIHFRGGSADAPLWRLDPELPPSPLSGFLQGILPPGGGTLLPPIQGLPAPTGGGGSVVLRLRGGGGGSLDAVVAAEEDGGRRVEVRGSGYWRWVAASPVGGALYRALWGGAAAWVLEGQGAEGQGREGPGGEIQVGEGQVSGAPGAEGSGAGAPGFEAPGAAGALSGAPSQAGRWVNPSLLPPPGPAGGEGPPEASEGALAPPDEATSPRAPGEDEDRRGLRTHPLPWFLVLAALSAEWILRRRDGLP